jgi:hypothetical protein
MYDKRPSLLLSFLLYLFSRISAVAYSRELELEKEEYFNEIKRLRGLVEWKTDILSNTVTAMREKDALQDNGAIYNVRK